MRCVSRNKRSLQTFVPLIRTHHLNLTVPSSSSLIGQYQSRESNTAFLLANDCLVHLRHYRAYVPPDLTSSKQPMRG